jgi:murein DD-endopeptidase MepM/ murein hydrolase activator NlpD
MMLVVVCAGIGFFIHDYQQLRASLPDVKQREAQIAAQQAQISNQQDQIAAFAEGINQLKGQLISLHEFEKKIKIIANIKSDPEQESLFGIGGTIPDDIDPRKEIAGQHHRLMRTMHQQVEQLQQAAHYQEAVFEGLTDQLQAQQNLLASTPAIRPIKGGWTTSGFGYRKSPFTGRREFHKALDLAARPGTPVVATANGVVTFVGKKGFLGKTMVINHGHGMVTRYGHLKDYVKKKGDKVERGDTIGLLGSTGRSTGPHVHYEVRLNGVPVNPKKYILN